MSKFTTTHTAACLTSFTNRAAYTTTPDAVRGPFTTFTAARAAAERSRYAGLGVTTLDACGHGIDYPSELLPVEAAAVDARTVTSASIGYPHDGTVPVLTLRRDAEVTAELHLGACTKEAAEAALRRCGLGLRSLWTLEPAAPGSGWRADVEPTVRAAHLSAR